MGRYQAYPEYKDSGVEWIKEIPSHWVMAKTSRFFKIGMGQTILKEDLVDDGEWPVFSATEGDHYLGRINNPNVKLDEGDIVIPARGNSIGSVKIVTERSTTTQTTIYCKPYSKRSIYQRYTYFYLNGQRQNLFRFTQTAIPQITTEEVGGNPLILPGYDEQIVIANFLDHETAKIDTLIEKQQQLIQLLKEKRQAVISHAVTKGLNPDVPMKDSGVEWLGEVPAGWVVARLKYHANLFEQGWSPQCDSRPAEDDEYGVLKVGCVNHGAFNCDENKALPRDLEPQLQYLLRKEDLLISRANTKELVGSAAVVDGDYDNLLLCDKLYRIRFDHLIVPQLVAYYLGLPIVRRQIELEASGASHSMQNIGQSTIKELPIVIPPRDEADALVIKIQEKVHVFNSIHKKVSDQIGLLQERRTALISAAVTGKIDVRLHASHPTGSA